MSKRAVEGLIPVSDLGDVQEMVLSDPVVLGDIGIQGQLLPESQPTMKCYCIEEAFILNDQKGLPKITIALLMAAGMGTRIRPLSESIPKPLIPVCGMPMIETLIQAVSVAGIQKIIITVGYKKEKYLYLKEKYDNITMVENTDYLERNTISSFYAAMNYLRGENCLICESDLFIRDPSVIRGEMDRSRYLIRNVPAQNYEWGFELQNGRIRQVVRPRPEVFLDHHMYGVAYWMSGDLEKLIRVTAASYHKSGYEQLAYDEVANEIFDEIDMGIIRVKSGQLYEIDCFEDLIKVDPSYEI